MIFLKSGVKVAFFFLFGWYAYHSVLTELEKFAMIIT